MAGPPGTIPTLYGINLGYLGVRDTLGGYDGLILNDYFASDSAKTISTAPSVDFGYIAPDNSSTQSITTLFADSDTVDRTHITPYEGTGTYQIGFARGSGILLR